MIRIETQNKYVEGQRENEAYFLDIVCCVRYQFCKESVRRVTPTEKHELYCVVCGEVYLPDSKKRIGKNGVILIQKFSRTELRIKENTEMIRLGFITSNNFPLLESGNKLMFRENFANFSLINKLYRFACLKKQAFGIKEALLF